MPAKRTRFFVHCRGRIETRRYQSFFMSRILTDMRLGCECAFARTCSKGAEGEIRADDDIEQRHDLGVAEVPFEETVHDESRERAEGAHDPRALGRTRDRASDSAPMSTEERDRAAQQNAASPTTPV